MASRTNGRSVLLALMLTGGVFLTGAAVAGCGGGGAGEQGQQPKAQQGQPPKRQQEQAREEFIRADFKKVDSDGSGTADREEAQNAMRADFKAMDLDRDGVVTLKDVQRELDRAGGGRAGNSLAKHLPYDKDGDDEISEQEYIVEVRREIYGPMDSDGNGEISVEEAIAFHNAGKKGREGR